MTHIDQISERLHQQLRRAVRPDVYEIWLAQVKVTGFDGRQIGLAAPAEIAAWVRDRFGTTLRQAAQASTGGGDISVALSADGAEAAAGEKSPDALPRHARARPMHPKYTFEQFVIGEANRFAHAAALSAAELPGTAYNPLFLVGPPGVGKTHLLHSIGNYVTAYGSGLTVRYTTAEDFTNDFRAAIDSRSTAGFKSHYRDADVLLIDDVQFLAHKVKTEEEFFHTFNALRESGSQIVLTADRPPREMAGLEERLCQRFESGLLVEIAAPDRTMRGAILRKRAAIDRLALDDEVIEVIADRVVDTVRALEAALIRVAAYASLTGESITPELAVRVLEQLYGREQARTVRTVSVDEVQRLVADSFGLSTDELLSPSRAARVSWPRQLAMFLAREETGQSLPAIGSAFGGRDHTTVLHACRRAAERLDSDPSAAQLAADLRERLTASDR